MKEATYYVCEICGASYKTEKQAISCEEYHVRVNSIVKTNYEMKGSRFGKYPKIITVKMDDGTSLEYSRLRI